jgi:phosphoribosylformylglycinamidine synthase
MALKGFNVLAITDCLNFGNPQKKEIMSEFVASVDAIVRASRELDAPVISGNVSFYNETLDQNIVSTPAIGMVGLRDSVENLISDKFIEAYESIYMIQLPWVESNLTAARSVSIGKPHYTQMDLEVSEFIKKTVGFTDYLRTEGIILSSIKAVGLGGLLSTCLKMANQKIGFDLSFNLADTVEDEFCKERFYAFLCTSKIEKEKFDKIVRRYYQMDYINIVKIGETTQGEMRISSSLEVDRKNFDKKFHAGPDEVQNVR